ncbi:Molybdenum cofactor sulfurase C-terminal [Pyrenophora seminiperda CCB06]|uniref:Molybdenum cofactor sulfurase C-terminal n=1 Tax=Pyrenophora seminiperda CCB06 TaxID=1302712 RepID=A0A3M7MH10_9PLEO|nr:Molybdenum cofactor sulfurase C-terminal [Pyrenophora seminiperda CCB06]
MQDQHEFNMEKVSPIWIVTGLCIVPLGLYFMLNLLSPLMHRFTAMKISEIYVYPIKSLRAVPMKEAIATAHGFKHDRTFMLLQKTESDSGGYKNMAVANYPEMTQFAQELDMDKAVITVTYLAYGDKEKTRTIQVPLTPETEKLDTMEISMHSSPTAAFVMPAEFSAWFSACFGYEVVLVYLSTNRRSVLFQDMQQQPVAVEEEASPRLTRLLQKSVPFASSLLPGTSTTSTTTTLPTATSPWKITFADCAPYLICSHTSLSNVSSRLPPGTTMDITKFRPNIVVSGAPEPFEEDYWGTLVVNGATEISLQHNCVRCKSINIDYETGKQGEGPSGEVLKRLQKDRRVDVGARWSPVFGRYGFLGKGVGGKGRGKGKGEEGEEMWRVGDRVHVKKVNERLTVFNWPNLG